MIIETLLFQKSHSKNYDDVDMYLEFDWLWRLMTRRQVQVIQDYCLDLLHLHPHRDFEQLMRYRLSLVESK